MRSSFSLTSIRGFSLRPFLEMQLAAACSLPARMSEMWLFSLVPLFRAEFNEIRSVVLYYQPC